LCDDQLCDETAVSSGTARKSAVYRQIDDMSALPDEMALAEKSCSVELSWCECTDISASRVIIEFGFIDGINTQ
jgi:hypothetical protein